MTIIAYKDGVMAADSGCWSSGREQIVPFPKITRAPDGSLLGLAGKLHDSWLLRQWVLAGMPQDAKPEFKGRREPTDDEPYILMAKPDGSLWFATGDLVFAPDPQPSATGAGPACNFCEGAMEAGMTAGDAVALAIRHFEGAGGTVQIEKIDPQ